MEMAYGKKIGVGVIIVSIILGIGYITNKDDGNKDDVEENINIIEEIKSEYVEGNATIKGLYGYIEDKESGLTMNGSDGNLGSSDVGLDVLRGLGIYNGEDIEKYGESMMINRYELALLLYNILLEYNAVPNYDGYQIKYSDSVSIPERYMTAIICTTYIGLYDYGDTYNGLKGVTNEEVKNSIDKCYEYINGYKKEEPLDTEENNEIDIEFSRETYEDRLNGGSVAVYKEPTKLSEVEANIEHIAERTLNTFSEELKAGSSRKMDTEYINLDEAFVNYSLLEDLSDKYDLISGVTKIEPYKFIVEKTNMGYEVRGEILKDYRVGSLFGLSYAVAVKDGIVQAIGSVTGDLDTLDTLIFDVDVSNSDYIGLIVFKEFFEGINKIVEGKEYKSIIILVPNRLG